MGLINFEFGMKLHWHRIGNMITLSIPKFLNSAIGSTPFVVITNTSLLPVAIQPSNPQFYIISYIDPAKVGQPGYPSGPPSSHRLSTLKIHAGVITIYRDLDNNGFTVLDTFSNSQPLVLSYLIA